jgi:hypothetical protein
MSDLIKQKKQVRRGRLASANPAGLRAFCKCADLMSDGNA